MTHLHPTVDAEPFGTLLGYAPGEVPVYSSYYESLKSEQMKSRAEFKSILDGIYMGYKWQCVEFARRWLYINKKQIFEDVSMAYEIFDLKELTDIANRTKLPLKSFANGSKKKPEIGSLLIWKEIGEFVATGHVAVITEIAEDYIRIAEQNLEHKMWGENCSWSRELVMNVTNDGEYFISCTYDDTEILGWVIQTDEDKYSYKPSLKNYQLWNIKTNKLLAKSGSWLDESNNDEKAFVKFMEGHRLASLDEDLGRYFCISQTCYDDLEHASNVLHNMFYKATDYVLEHEEYLKYFNFPQQLIPRIKRSWENRKTHNIMGRFDFSVSERGIKVYEYNSDSAGCFFECGLVQGLWSEHHSCKIGFDAGGKFFQALVQVWKNNHVNTIVHVLRDNDPEEIYLAEYMVRAIKAAGLEAKVIDDLNKFSFNQEAKLIDDENKLVEWVWKSWAWETAIDQLRGELAVNPEFKLENNSSSDSHLRLFDVLLHPDVMVFEPLWALITSNKAILPILWKLFPNHPYLLECSFELSEVLKKKAYVEKPIVGRCGKNITIKDSENNILESTDGQFSNQDLIYQEFWELPNLDSYYTQLSTFMVDGREAGACIRASKSMILDSMSDVFPLRVVSDKDI